MGAGRPWLYKGEDTLSVMREGLEQGLTIKGIADKLCVTMMTIHNWKKEYTEVRDLFASDGWPRGRRKGVKDDGD